MPRRPLAMPRRDDAAPLKSITVFAEYTAHTAAALGSSCGEEACGLFGELFRKLEVRAGARNPGSPASKPSIFIYAREKTDSQVPQKVWQTRSCTCGGSM